jgi:general secretion pathway protein C
MLESSRFVLLGVLDPGHAHGLASRLSSGTALVAVDGQSAKPVAVGAVLVDGWTLQSVQGRSAVLERQGSRITLELPSLPAPAGFELKGKNGP